MVFIFKKKKSDLTLGLIGINLIFFALEMWFGGSRNLETLYYLGALVPEDVWAGEWWRIVTANFLHYDWLHLSTNMLGIYFFGRFVEFNFGRVKYITIYLFSGLGAMFSFTIISQYLGYDEQLLVGASAAIMGLIGAILALFIKEWRQEQSRFTNRRLKLILLIIACQFIFDFATPQVSFLSHLLGLIIGFLTGVMMI